MKRKKSNQRKNFHSASTIYSDLFTWSIPTHGRLFMFHIFINTDFFYAGTSKMSWRMDWTVIFALVYLSIETFKVTPNPYSKANQHAFWWSDFFCWEGKGKRNDTEINILVLISRLSIIVVILIKSRAMEEIWSLVSGQLAISHWLCFMNYDFKCLSTLEECAKCTEGGLRVRSVIFQHLSYKLTTRNKSIKLFTTKLVF